MNSKILILLSLIALTISYNSGVKVAVDMNIVKALKQLNLNELLANQILVDHIEESGQFLFKYDLTVDNLTITNISNPTTVDVIHNSSSEGYPLVKLDIKNISVDLTMAFYVKFGVFTEQSDCVKVHTVVTSFEGEFYFRPNGSIVIQNANLELSDLKIDMDSKWLNFLIGIFKNLITNQAQKAIKEGTEKGQEYVNNWIVNQTLVDIGFGIGLNVSNTEIPVLTKYTKSNRIMSTLFGLFFGQKRANIKRNAETTILTTGIHGSIYPNLHPELKPKIDDAVDMKYDTSLYKNEIQALVSDYSINTVLFMGQQTGILHVEMQNGLNNTIPWDYSVNGLKDVLPEYPQKYPSNNYQVQMKAYVSVNDHNQPKLATDVNGKAKFYVNFGLDFYTFNSEDPMDDPVKDLQINFSANVDVDVKTSDNTLRITLGSLQFSDSKTIVDNLNVDMDRFKNTLVKAVDDYVYPELYKYIKEVKVVELLKEATNIDFKDFTVVTQKGYYIGSIGLKTL